MKYLIFLIVLFSSHKLFSQRVRIDTLVIGSSNPRSPFHIVSPNGDTASITFSANGGGTPVQARIGVVDNFYSGDLIFQTAVPGNSNNPLVDRIRILSGGNIGIGTSNPSAILSISEKILFHPNGKGVTLDPILEFTNTGWNRIGGNGTLAFYGDSSTFNNNPNLIINSDNKVGINLTNPSESLDVGGNVQATSFRARGGSPGVNGVSNNGYTFNGGNGDSDGGMFSSSDGQIEFYTNNSERLRIMSSGNIGINNLSPTERLDVSGNIRLSGALMPNNQSGTSGQFLRSNGPGIAPSWISMTNTSIDSTTASNGLNMNGKDIRLGGNLASNTSISIGSNSLSFTGSSANAFNVDGSTLSVDALNNRVGINLTNPSESLDVGGTARAIGFRANGGLPNNNSGYSFRSSNGDEDGGMFSTSDGQLEFYTNNSERVKINSSGAVAFNGSYGNSGQLLVSNGQFGSTSWTSKGAVLSRSGNVNSTTPTASVINVESEGSASLNIRLNLTSIGITGANIIEVNPSSNSRFFVMANVCGSGGSGSCNDQFRDVTANANSWRTLDVTFSPDYNDIVRIDLIDANNMYSYRVLIAFSTVASGGGKFLMTLEKLR